MPETFVIEPPGRRQSGKGRIFEVYALNYGLANEAWKPLSESPDHRHRPVYLAFAATEQAARAFTANLMKGRPFVAMSRHGGRDAELEMPRSAGYRWMHQRAEGGVTITTALLPDLFLLDAGMLEDRIRFVFAPPRWWVTREALRMPEGVDLGREAVIASYFAALLDRRSSQPIINDPAFHIRLLRAAREEGMLKVPRGGRATSNAVYSWPEAAGMIGFDDFALVDCAHAAFEELLAEQTSLFAHDAPAWLQEEPEPEVDPIPLASPASAPEEDSIGEVRSAGHSWLLSDPHTTPAQLRLPGLL